MSTENIPCKNPKLCGVQTHRPGTVAKCMTQGASKSSSGAPSNLSATPSLASSSSAPSQVKLTKRGEELLKELLDGDEKEVVVGNAAGTKQIIALNTTADVGSMFHNSDQAAFGRIVTSSGATIYAVHHGGPGTYIYKDGVEIQSWVHPEGDEPFEVVPGQITSEEFRALEEADKIATEVGNIDSVDQDGVMSEEDHNREVVRRALEHEVPQRSTPSRSKLNARKKADLEQDAKPAAPSLISKTRNHH